MSSKFDLLATQPLMGRARDELKPKLRSFVVGNYVVFYLPTEDGVAVERVLGDIRILTLTSSCSYGLPLD